MKTLIIVESPTKAKTIGQFLGKGYVIEPSYGHLRDLPRSQLGIDTEHNFEPHYVVPRKNNPLVKKLKKAAQKAAKIILATDEDREGEAIAWHIIQIFKKTTAKEKPFDESIVQRIAFHEITNSAISEALKNPRAIDINLVDAQQARRILDRLVGYKLSPFLWKKVARGLSAGRVQSVALRLIIERENEIKKFKAEEYFTINAKLKAEKKEFEAQLSKINGEKISEPGIKLKEETEKIKKELENSDFKVSSAEKKEMHRHPLPPFITSTLQQEAARRFGFSSKKTMFLAQHLYENGLITYMRTDSVNLAKEALTSAASWIKDSLGNDYVLPKFNVYKNKSRLSQEAHEAIRPTDPKKVPGEIKLEKDFAKLYDLIWKRFIASQLPEAVFDLTQIEISAKKAENSYTLNASGSILRFDGFLKIWPTKFEDKELPEVEKGQMLDLLSVESLSHFTEPPPRYSEATLIKTLEKHGIGRPSTYAPIISVIQTRNYVKKEKRYFFPTEIGELVNKVLTENFSEIFDVQFTAKMEGQLDEIAEGKEKWQKVIGEFYEPFSKLLEKKYQEVGKVVAEEKTDILCDKCGRPMVIKFGRFGRFLACSGFPECKNVKSLPKEPPKKIGLKCPKCQIGDIVEKRVNKGRARGKIFWGCSRYPDCDYASWTNPLNPPPAPKQTDE